MQTNYRRIALLTGVSAAALGATPAFAAPHYPAPAPHDAVADGTYAGYFDAGPVDTVDICAIAVTPDCFLGEKQTGPGAQTATVNSVASGQVHQVLLGAATPVDFNVVVGTGDFAEIGAFANATTGGLADASVFAAISQWATGTDDISLSVENNGQLLIDALAVSTGGTAAVASADLSFGVWQSANSTGGDVFNAVINNGSALTIAATAVAMDGWAGVADAELNNGIFQVAVAGDTASNIVDNGTGTLNIGAYAIALGTSSFAVAEADVNLGIGQFASVDGGGDASNSITNAGLLNVSATAFASSPNAGWGFASADASVATGIIQVATAWDGTASNSIDNDGTLNVAAIAVANGANTALADADVLSGIVQNASITTGGWGSATNSITNSAGDMINIVADASANASFGDATANANLISGIQQNAVVLGVGTTINTGGDASNAIANAGTLNIAAIAAASAGGTGNADANASLEGGISQVAAAVFFGDASNSITNSAGGAIQIGAIANATATSQWASASADVNDAINQDADAFGTGTGDATNSLANGGTLVIQASALANATGAATTGGTTWGAWAGAWASATTTRSTRMPSRGATAMHRTRLPIRQAGSCRLAPSQARSVEMG
jgi:hypothetical protein